MKYDTISETPAAVHVLNINPSDVAPFVRKCVRERSLSVLVKDLNHALLFGTETQRKDAKAALQHIGFL
ncbi:MAG: hypothetical protein V2I76_09120 [Roseobacter sp.]|jgi:hypothetical protein|nr:hypothetical protein [Roseobacter sp.]